MLLGVSAENVEFCRGFFESFSIEATSWKFWFSIFLTTFYNFVPLNSITMYNDPFRFVSLSKFSIIHFLAAHEIKETRNLLGTSTKVPVFRPTMEHDWQQYVIFLYFFLFFLLIFLFWFTDISFDLNSPFCWQNFELIFYSVMVKNSHQYGKNLRQPIAS